MSDRESTLPAGFDDLAKHAGCWALPTEQARHALRLGTPLSQIRVFYDAIHPRMDDVLRHLAGFRADDLPGLPATTRRLYHLALSYFEASHPIELHWKGPDLDNAFPASRTVYQAPSCEEN